MDHLCQIASPQWTDKETKEYVKNCNTSFSISRQDGKERVAFRACALLNGNAQPIAIEEFMIQSGQRKMLIPIEKPYRRYEEYLAIQLAKKEWNKTHKNYRCAIATSFSGLQLASEMAEALNNN